MPTSRLYGGPGETTETPPIIPYLVGGFSMCGDYFPTLLVHPIAARLLHPRINHLYPVPVISDPAKLSPTLFATFDRKHLGGALGQLNQLAITAKLEEIAMQHTNLLRCKS